VQQKQGRVAATQQANGMAFNFDAHLEDEADGIQASLEGLSKPCLSAPRHTLSPVNTSSRVVQAKLVYNDYPLNKHIDDIIGYIEDQYEDNEDIDEIINSLKAKAADKKNNNFEVWAKKYKLDWADILREAVGFDPDWEEDLFGKSVNTRKVGGAMEGHPLTGMVPVDPKSKEKMLEQVPRSDFYTHNTDLRVLQLLRQISSQLYFHLQQNKLLAKEEQEIQTMWTHGNLLIGSNQLGTTKNLFKQITSIGKDNEQLYSMLVSTYMSEKSYFRSVSERHAQKINTLYQGVRDLGSPEIQKIIINLWSGTVKTITDITDDKQIKEFTSNTGNIYILCAESPNGYSHAEQRLIEFRDAIFAYDKSGDKTWVAGKKRPCFGCWVREIITNETDNYELVYQDQPGKAFMNTYLSAPPEEKKTWHEKSKEEDLTVYESKTGGGKIGPESDSEAEEAIGWDDPNSFYDDISKEKLKRGQRKSVEYHFSEAVPEADFEEVEAYLKKRRKSSDEIDSEQEDTLENASKKIKTYANSSQNPAVRKIFRFSSSYKKKIKKTPRK